MNVRLVAAVTGRGDRQHPERGCPLDGQRQVVVEGLTVVGTQRHIDDVHGIRGVAVAVRVYGEFHSLDQRNAGAGAGNRGAHLDGIKIGARGHAAEAAGNVGHVRAMTLEVDGILVRRERAEGPDLADEVIAFHYLVGGEQPVAGSRVVVGRVVVRDGAAAAQIRVGVVDAAVKYGNSYASAVDSGTLNGAGADIGHRLRQVHLVVLHPMDGDDVAVRSELVYFLRVDLEEDRVQNCLDAGQFLTRRRGPVRALHECRLFVLELGLVAHPSGW